MLLQDPVIYVGMYSIWSTVVVLLQDPVIYVGMYCIWSTVVVLLKDPVIYVAIYDYVAQDLDEVDFEENDHIINCECIDEGWVVGTVEKTGQRGMIPSNYIEIC